MANYSPLCWCVMRTLQPTERAIRNDAPAIARFLLYLAFVDSLHPAINQSYMHAHHHFSRLLLLVGMYCRNCRNRGVRCAHHLQGACFWMRQIVNCHDINYEAGIRPPPVLLPFHAFLLIAGPRIRCVLRFVVIKRLGLTRSLNMRNISS